MNLLKTADFFPWSPTAWLRVSGEDAANFLQGQFTNELRNLKPGTGEAVYGLWLNQKGKVLADSFVLRTEEAFWLASYSSPAAVLKERLEAYIIADDVNVEDLTAEWAGMTVFATEKPAAGAPGLCWEGRRGEDASFEWLFPVEKRGEVMALLGEGRVLTAAEVERKRIAAGIPLIPQDLGPTDLPNEGGLEGQAISYTKGCYLGQEVMARLKAMGQVRRRLVRLRAAEGDVPGLPAELFQAGKKIGELRSAVKNPDGHGFSGLAMLTLMHWRKDTGLGFTATGPELAQGEIL